MSVDKEFGKIIFEWIEKKYTLQRNFSLFGPDWKFHRKLSVAPFSEGVDKNGDVFDEIVDTYGDEGGEWAVFWFDYVTHSMDEYIVFIADSFNDDYMFVNDKCEPLTVWDRLRKEIETNEVIEHILKEHNATQITYDLVVECKNGKKIS